MSGPHIDNYFIVIAEGKSKATKWFGVSITLRKRNIHHSMLAASVMVF